jgi:hypothetical protein
MVKDDLSFLFAPPQDSDVFTRTLYYPRSPGSPEVPFNPSSKEGAAGTSSIGDNRHTATLSKFRAGVFASHSSAAVETVAPFLNEHIPDQVHIPDDRTQHAENDRDKVYCYRHQPDLRCQRRTPQEDTMAEIQKVASPAKGRTDGRRWMFSP